MAKRTRKQGYLMYGVYALVAWYGYQWWSNRQNVNAPIVAVPTGTTT